MGHTRFRHGEGKRDGVQRAGMMLALRVIVLGMFVLGMFVLCLFPCSFRYLFNDGFGVCFMAWCGGS